MCMGADEHRLISQSAGTILWIMHNVMWIMQRAGFFLAYRTMAVVSEDSHARCINQTWLELRCDYIIHWAGPTHLDRALCPLSPAPSAGCRTTTRRTWWWISRTERLQGPSTWWETWPLKEIQKRSLRFLSRKCCDFSRKTQLSLYLHNSP